MSTNHETASNGRQKADTGSIAKEVASRGIRTPRELSNFALGATLDVVNGTRGVSESNAVFRGTVTTAKMIELGVKIGENKHVLDAPGKETPLSEEERCAIVAEEQELTARLEALRERRGG